MKLTKKSKKLLIQFAEYMVSGGAWFWIGYGAFAFFDLVLGWDFWPTKITSYFVGASINFFLQRFWVFNHKSAKKELGDAATRYYSLMTANFFIDQFIVWGLLQLGITPYIGQFVASGFFTVWNWLWYSQWVFKRQRVEHATKSQHAPVLKKHKRVQYTKGVSKRKRKAKV